MVKSKGIPKSFKLGGVKYNVEMKKKVFLDREQIGGTSDVFECSVEIAKMVNGTKCSTDYRRQTFYHELVHQILDILGDFELSENEKFVQGFSVLLDQFEQTKKY
jgi:hypothetical protein